jgi:hypothetical protein
MPNALYWDVLIAEQTEDTVPERVLAFHDSI